LDDVEKKLEEQLHEVEKKLEEKLNKVEVDVHQLADWKTKALGASYLAGVLGALGSPGAAEYRFIPAT
jgi:hypothetical protein